MTDEKLLRLLHVAEELSAICQRLNENQNSQLASCLVPITDRLTDELTRITLEMSVPNHQWTEGNDAKPSSA